MEKLYDDLIKQLIEIGRTEIIPSIPESEFSYLREGQWQRTRYPEDCDSGCLGFEHHFSPHLL